MYKDKIKQKATLKRYQETHKEKRRAAAKTWREANKEKAKTRHKTWYATHLKEKKVYNKAYYSSHSKERKIYDANHSEEKKSYRKNNRERYKEHKQNRRALKRTTQVEPISEKVVYLRDGWICQICHKRVDKRLKHPDPMSASLDHITPLSKDGAHTYSNVQLAHYICNISKQNNVLPQGEQLRMF